MHYIYEFLSNFPKPLGYPKKGHIFTSIGLDLIKT